MRLDRDVLLGERYRLRELIAIGGMGEVWRGEDETLGRPVAVKVLKGEYVDDPEFRDRFRAEARHTAALSHPGIANVYDYGEVPDGSGRSGGIETAYLVMELVDGEPLSTLLERERVLPTGRTLDVIGQAALALQAAHDIGVVHRDVKPGNLLLRPDGAVKVTDFGIARAVDANTTTGTGLMVGSAYYASPEQASGAPVTPASDVYSLGVVAYECLAGDRPFTGRTPHAVALAHTADVVPPLPDDVPVAVQALVGSALEKDPLRRPQSAGDFGASALALRDAVAPTPAGEQPAAGSVLADEPLASLSNPPEPTASRHRRRRSLGLIGGLVAVVVAALAARGCDRQPDPDPGATRHPSAAVAVAVPVAAAVPVPVAVPVVG